jgi:hypothetical protein
LWCFIFHINSFTKFDGDNTGLLSNKEHARAILLSA